MTEAKAKEILQRNQYGILATVDKNLQPYGVPLNYFYIPEENAIYFHCSKRGRKINNLRVNPKVSFSIVDSENIVEEKFTTDYTSLNVEGTISFIEEAEEQIRLLRLLCQRLAPHAIERREEVIHKYLPAVLLLKLSIESLSGKEKENSKS